MDTLKIKRYEIKGEIVSSKPAIAVIRRIEDENGEWCKYHDVEELKTALSKLKAENVRLRCCGNCSQLDKCIEEKNCNVDPAGSCDKWGFGN